MSLQSWIDTADLINKAVATAAIIVGGWWVLFRFGKERAYRPRLELNVSGTVRCKNNLSYLSITYELKSVGYPKTHLGEESGLLIFASRPFEKIDGPVTVIWEDKGGHPVFDKHDWIEHDETITGTLLMALPGCDQLAYRLELTVFAGSLEWNTEAIIFNEPSEGGGDVGQ